MLKAKQSHNTSMEAQGERMYSSYLFTTSALGVALGGVSGQRHAPAALYPRGKFHRYPLDRRLGGPQSRSGLRGLEEKSFASTGDRTSLIGDERNKNVKQLCSIFYIHGRDIWDSAWIKRYKDRSQCWKETVGLFKCLSSHTNIIRKCNVIITLFRDDSAWDPLV
jgi:hypothetical protein